VIDFTSSLYLGMRHGSASVPPWAQLTTGVPAALASPPVAGAVAGELARVMGVEAASMAASTIHAFWDLFVVVAGNEARTAAGS